MLKPEECVLVVVDVQGQLARVVQQSERLHQKLEVLIKGVQLFDIPILWLEQLPEKLGPTSDNLAQALVSSCHPISKQHFSAWQASDFRSKLNALPQKQIILVGIETHICVYQTCIELLENGYKTHLVVDATSSREEANKLCGIQMMQASGAQQTNVESLLFELQQQAMGERFKALLKLIK
ncbi:isochorismatase family protein [Shewanella schlegeliana]|uniref:Isochorismatase family protein n=1 Tax=Shewanella schlegeliana TaxID=190308 RepID=A0ABS1SWV2_9GAMM|nr:isochorismatase family protein [Shewanella schlegeliana]MBL4912379.1 isochorismatase family protein [Shewanella schlegeliana]MCL1108151.1 isochorismatase family protein [Shewanella schlegeliana]GIU21991.1 hydrolase [Shewanella schlegeliana]